MSSSDSTPSTELAPVKFSRLTRRGILLGLSATQLVALAVAVATIVTAVYSGGGMLLAYTAPIWAVCVALTWVPVAGRPLVEWLPVGFWWLWKTTGGQLLYRRRIVTPRPEGTLALPGDMARLREYTDPTSGACMIHDPHAATLTAICEVSHPAFILLDPGEQERRVTTWGRVLATACRSGRIATLQVLERTLPDSGTGLAEWWAQHGTQDDSWASTTYAELIERAGPAGERHATTISLALNMRTAARQIRTAGDVAVILRSAYDPAMAAALERHGSIGRELATAGPVAVTETWGGLRTDSAHHTVLWISEWPRSLVYPGFLAPLALSTGIQRSISLLYTPLRSDIAARDIRKKKVEYLSDATQRARIGQIEDAAQTAEYHDVLQQESELTAGHGVLRYSGLIAISAPSEPELESAVAAIEQAAIQASCEIRRLVGQQAQAFTAAALPLARTI